MNEKLNDAMDCIDEKYLAEAARRPRQVTRKMIISYAAAVLALVIGLGSVLRPMGVKADAIAVASSVRLAQRPEYNKYIDKAKYATDMNNWINQRDGIINTVSASYEATRDFYRQTDALVLSDNGRNAVYSPVNVLMALAMLAEATDGNTRAEILQAVGAKDMDDLRSTVSSIYELTYKDDGKEICTIANSLWLDKGYVFKQPAVDSMSYHCYADVFQKDLNSDAGKKAVVSWVNEHTGNFLKDTPPVIDSRDPVEMVMASTVYIQSKWSQFDKFSAAKNTRDAFHSPSGDKTVTFMRQDLERMYSWGESFGATFLNLSNGCRLWMFLPDEGKSVSDILANDEYLRVFQVDPYAEEQENAKYMIIHLSLPKFDVSSSREFSDVWAQLGFGDVFLPQGDFSGISDDPNLYLSSVQQASRVQVDEEGLTAASYIVELGAGAAPPPDDQIDFCLDRPFLFVVESNGVPMFTGIVNEP